MREMERQISEIHDVLVGSKLHPKGLIGRVDELEQFKSSISQIPKNIFKRTDSWY